jgi:hypothetical protein
MVTLNRPFPSSWPRSRRHHRKLDAHYAHLPPPQRNGIIPPFMESIQDPNSSLKNLLPLSSVALKRFPCFTVDARFTCAG